MMARRRRSVKGHSGTKWSLLSLLLLLLSTASILSLLFTLYTSIQLAQPPAGLRQLLSTEDLCTISTDVRGNLGPASVMLGNGTDWIKDRWQAASDMHGTQITGEHWVQLDFARLVNVDSMILDWEAAYSDHYRIQVRQNAGQEWNTVLEAPSPSIDVQEIGQSPGVKKPTPLHVIHQFDVVASNVQSLRILILKSPTGWGVSLWQVQVYGVLH